jgi:hypothetical protein
MKRVTLSDFSGGLHNAKDAELIPDNALSEAINYEYGVDGVLKKRKGTDLSELEPLRDADFKNIAVWYPSRRPDNLHADADVIYLVHYGTTVRMYYKDTADGVLKSMGEIVTGIPAENSVSFFVSSTRVLIADGFHPVQQLFTNLDYEIQTTDVGLSAPQYFPLPTTDTSVALNEFVLYTADDIGMGVERGNILQYAYTVEDKYGSESNPSPIASFSDLMQKYPDPLSPTGFLWYWYKAQVNGLQIKQYDTETQANLKYYNIYRRDIEFHNGTISKQFNLVYHLPIAGVAGGDTYIDTSGQNLGDISYTNEVAPVASTVTAVNNTIFVGDIKRTNNLFPFMFDGYLEISLLNNNDIDYAEPVIHLAIKFSEHGLDWIDSYSGNSFIVSYPDKFRFFFKDLITPCPTMVGKLDGYFHFFVRIPYIDREATTNIYFCYVNPTVPDYLGIPLSGRGVTNTDWDSIAYGKFCDAYGSMPHILKPVRVMDTNVKINTLDPGWDGFFSSIPRLPNWADWLKTGSFLPVGCVTERTNIPLRLPVLNNYRSANNMAMYMYGSDELNQCKQTFSGTGRIIIYANNSYKLSSIQYGEYFIFMISGVVDGSDIYDVAYYIKYISSTKVIQIWYKTRINGGAWAEDGEPTRVEVTPSDFGGISFNDSMYDIQVVTDGLNFRVSIINELHVVSRVIKNRTNTYLSANHYKLFTGAFPANSEVSRDYYIYTNVSGVIKHDQTINQHMILDNQQRYGITYIAAIMESLISQTTYFEEGIGWDGSTNINCVITNRITTKSVEPNMFRWSDINGSTFPTVNFSLVKEPILAMAGQPSFLKFQYQNSLVVLTRNTVNRYVFSDDMQSLAFRPNDVIEEFSSCGLYATDSLALVPNGLIWLSERGVILWTADGIQQVSHEIIDLQHRGRAADFHGAYLSDTDQYLLCDANGGDYTYTWIYHVGLKRWTRAGGLYFTSSAILNLGRDYLNKLLLLGETLYTYPSLNNESSGVYLTTKKIRLDNIKPVRIRGLWHDLANEPVMIQAQVYNNEFAGGTTLTHTIINPERFKWLLLPNGFWGEWMQLEIHGCGQPTRIEIDFKEGV